MSDTRPRVAVLGGAVAGLAAAERLRELGHVTLFERQSYADKRVNCGEAINEAGLVPLAHTPGNGFLTDVDGFEVRVHESPTRSHDADPVATATIMAPDGYITDRDLLERRWADRLRQTDAVTVREDSAVSVSRYREFVDGDEFDIVVDATGSPSLTARARNWTDRYTGELVALNAEVEGSFASWRRTPRIIFEGYLGYFWAFPKSADRANVGIGWAPRDRPDDYLEALWAACDRAAVPRPERGATSVYTIPEGPALDPALTRPEPGVFLVGDAAGIANRYQGEGITQAIRSAYLLADCLESDRGASYPGRLYRTFRSEYRLAALMRGLWEETGDAELLGAVVRVIDGLTVEDVTRRPGRVVSRLARSPGLAVRLASNSSLRSRVVDAFRDRWEFGTVSR